MQPAEMQTGCSKDAWISVIIPVRNRADLLFRCIESLMGQDAAPESYEIVVCNDGSIEDIGIVVQRFQPGPPTVRLLSQAPLGPAAARNLGIRATEAPVVIFLDSDIVAEKGLVACLASSLVQNPGWLGAEACLIPIGGKESPLWDAPSSGSGGRYHTAAIAYRRDALIAVGGLDETFKMPACEDVELAVRVLAQGPIGFVPEAKVYHPRRRVVFTMHWRWRKHWKYVMILAKRYGILAFPGKDAGPFPRIRVAIAAVVTLPAGRFIEGIRHTRRRLSEGALTCVYALFDVLCGICALPDILLGEVPEQQNYLQ